VIAQRLQQIWYGGRRPGPLLRALEQVYRATYEWRSRGQADPELEGKPIIVVGNITAGGTGKTPLVMRLTELLTAAEYRVAVVSRGYGRAGRDAVRVDESTPASVGGDEPVLIARRCGVVVHVDADREAAARRAFSEGADVVIADDGLQRVSLPRRLELCVVDGARGFGNGHLMPAGPLREPVTRLASVDAVVVNGEGTPAGLPGHFIRMTLRPTEAVRLDNSQRIAANEMRDHDAFRNVTALAGTGNPQRFFGTLEALGLQPARCMPFDDHYQFREQDFADLKGTVLMTEKDAVKCQELKPPDTWFLKVEADLDPQWEQEFLALSEAIIK